MEEVKSNNIDTILKALPILAPNVSAAIIQIMFSPALTKEQYLAQAEDLDNQTLAIIESELAKLD